jgi:sugar lactone lactonase YvrE
VAGAAAPAPWSGCAAARAVPADRYAGLRSRRYLGGARVETRVAGEQVFLEGPAVSPEGEVFFTNVPASQILRWDPRARRLAVWREPSNRANGLAFDRQGRLLAFAQTPEDTVTNCAFGGPDGRTLYVTSGSLLLSIPTRIPGEVSRQSAP